MYFSWDIFFFFKKVNIPSRNKRRSSSSFISLENRSNSKCLLCGKTFETKDKLSLTDKGYETFKMQAFQRLKIPFDNTEHI